jgi:actin-binding LIM protein
MNEEDDERAAAMGGSDSPPPPINAKLQREIEEISKIENESSMAAALLSDLRTHQKIISRKLKIDPWKASRTPSANIEPTVRTRFESPVNASPSRLLYNRSNGGGGLSSTISGHNLSVTPGFQTSHTYFGGEHSSLASPRSAATLSSTSTILAAPQLNSSAAEGGPHTGMKAATLPAQQQLNSMFYPSSNQSPTSSYLNRNNYINSSSRVISSSATQKAALNNIVHNIAVPKPGYGLSTPIKSITLPSSSRYTGLSNHQSADYESPKGLYSSSSYYNTPISPQYAECEEELKVYSYDILKVNRRKRLPADVNRDRLELHLSPQEFEEIFGMNLKYFLELSEWKKVDLKKRAKLF